MTFRWPFSTLRRVGTSTIGDRYRVARRLGSGGMARVYLCWDDRLSMWCAIKVMEPKAVSDPVQRARFVQEAKTLARLGHPHLVRLFDLAEDVESPFMVMEYCEGGTVAARLTRGAMDPAQAALLTADVCSALQAAHDAGVVHRDIKPQNLLLDGDGTIKVGDFGVARVEQELRLTMSNMALGTLAYMAPEQQRDAAKVDHRADIYSAGASMWAMITARRPVPLMTGDRQRALEAIPDGPLRTILDRATAPSRRDRYLTARSLEAALRDAAHAMGGVAPGAPPLIDHPQPPPDEPPTNPLADLRRGELDGTTRPWDGAQLVPGVLRAVISQDGSPARAVPEPDPVVPRRAGRGVTVLTLFLVTLCAGGCAGFGVLSGIGSFLYWG